MPGLRRSDGWDRSQGPTVRGGSGVDGREGTVEALGCGAHRTEPALKEGGLEQREQRIQKGCNGTCWGAKGDRPQSSTSSNLHPSFHPRLPPSDLTSNSKGSGDLRWLSLSQIMKEDSLMRDTKDQRSRGTSSGCQFGPTAALSPAAAPSRVTTRQLRGPPPASPRNSEG